MKKISLISCFVLLTLFVFQQEAIAQQSPMAKRMDIFVGDWKYEHMEGESKCVWLGKLTLHCESSWINKEGKKMKMVWLNRYDSKAKLYTTHRFYSNGYMDSGLGWVDGNTWTYVYDVDADNRYRITVVMSENTSNYKWHRSLKGGPWEPTGEGSMKKVK